MFLSIPISLQLVSCFTPNKWTLDTFPTQPDTCLSKVTIMMATTHHLDNSNLGAVSILSTSYHPSTLGWLARVKWKDTVAKVTMTPSLV